jgi:two-component system, chemotaxis family, CheB/CheR fusion protein
MSDAPAPEPAPGALASPLPMSWYQVTLSAIGDAVLTTDPEGRVTYMNPAAESLTGWEAGESLGRPLEDVFRIVNEQTRRPVEQPVRKVLETGLTRGLAARTTLIARDGTERPIDDSATPIRDEAGNVLGIALVFHDISERRRAERLAQDARDYAESIVGTVREPLLILDSDLRVKSASRSFYQAFAVTPEVTEGRLVYELGNGQWDIPCLRRLLEEVLPQGNSFRDFEVDHVFESIGRRRMVLNGRKVWTPENHSELILLAIEDITQRWRVGVEFGAIRERYRVIVEGATSYAIFTFDMRGLVTTWNRGAETMLGYSEDEMLGQDFRVIFTPEDIAAGLADVEMWSAEHEGRALDECWHVRKGGERFWANGLVMPLKDDADQTRGFLKVIRDMTPEKRLEESLRERTAALERADANKNRFLAMLAHELRNPLAAIRNAVAVAARSHAAEDLDWGMDVIGREVRNFGHLIDDLLDVGRITEGKIQLRREIIDATRIVHDSVEAAKPLLEERGHEFRLLFTSTDLQLDADPIRLEQILVNLLTNAAKYTPSGGRIELVAGVEGEDVVFRVRDNGVGISPELLPQMFELFSQGDRSLDRSEGGLGIGLTLAQSLAEMHGGTITALSEGPGSGSEFVVRLPAVRDKAPALPSPGDGPANEVARSGRVLVIDDHVPTAQGMARLLKLAGHDVRVAHNGFDALGEARKQRPEVIILDIGLPGMDGYELAAQLRREECGKDAVLIAVSGYGDEQARSRSREAGCDHHLVKPVDTEAILSLIQQHSPAS